YADPLNIPSFPTRRSSDLIESTRKFSRIDEDDSSMVDNNIDSKNIDQPVTDREYNRQSGVDTEELNEIDREDPARTRRNNVDRRSEEHTSELQSRFDLVCR